jgi:hypothetical protein
MGSPPQMYRVREYTTRNSAWKTVSILEATECQEAGSASSGACFGNRILAAGVRASLGHVSMRVPGDPHLFVVKGRGYRVDVLSRLRPADMVVCDLQGNWVDQMRRGASMRPAMNRMALSVDGRMGCTRRSCMTHACCGQIRWRLLTMASCTAPLINCTASRS